MIQHVMWFLVITLISSLVYHALRVDCLKTAALVGFKRFVSFAVIGAAGGLLLYFFTRWL